MTYQITVPQMQCSGCSSLITLTLEDDFQKITPSLENKTIAFESDKTESEVKEKLDILFKDLKSPMHKYEYTQLTEIK